MNVGVFARAALVVAAALGSAVILHLALAPVLPHAWIGLLAAAVAIAAWLAGRRAGFAAGLVGIGAAAATSTAETDAVSAGAAALAVTAAFIASTLRRARDDRTHASRVERQQAARAARLIKERRREFLEHASRVLSSSPDSQATLTALANLAVPQIADWCVIDMLQDDGSFVTVAAAHRDPEKVKLIREIRGAYPLMRNADGPPQAVRTGRSIVYEEVAEDLMRTLAPAAHQVKIAQALGLHSAMVVPLLVGGRRLGVISLMTAESGRKYTAADLTFAEDLARRAAVAIDTVAP